MVEGVCNPITVEAEAGRSLGYTGQPTQSAFSRPVISLVSKTRRKSCGDGSEVQRALVYLVEDSGCVPRTTCRLTASSHSVQGI